MMPGMTAALLDPVPDPAPDPALLGWLRLARCRGLGHEAARRLVRVAGSAEAWAEGPAPALAALLGDETRAALADPALDRAVADELRRARAGGWVLLHPDHPAWPASFGHLTDPPAVLAVAGTVEAVGAPAVALVGSRKPTGYGLRMAAELGAGLARLGYVVVSGLARGIDGAAHRAALDAGGRTVAVMATGPDSVYPREHERLARAIRGAGALVTEFPPGVRPEAYHFPHRNRLIAALADVLVVVEAAERSGSLITAGCAAGLGRPVLAVPGRAGDPVSGGTLGLLRDGAGVACTVADVLVEMPSGRAPLFGGEPAPDGGPPCALDPAARELLARVPRDDEIHVDQLAAATGFAPDRLLAALFTLQLAGLVDALPGGHFRRSTKTSG